MKKLLFFLSTFIVLNGCSYLVYRPDIQQGNIITAEMTSQLKPGMSDDQVRYIMGNPLLINTFAQNQQQYIYTNQPAKGQVERKIVTIYFVDGFVKSFNSN